MRSGLIVLIKLSPQFLLHAPDNTGCDQEAKPLCLSQSRTGALRIWRVIRSPRVPAVMAAEYESMLAY